MRNKEISLNVRGNVKQLQAVKYWIDDTTIDIAYGGSKGSGKSFLGCSLICADALMYPGTHYFIARKTLTDLRKFTIPSVHEILDIWGIGKEYYKYNGQDNYFHFHNGSKIFLLDAKYQPSDPNLSLIHI
jgi:phage terminase large subunit